MKFTQKGVLVQPVILTFDKSETKVLKEILTEEPKRSILLTSYEEPNRLVVEGNNLYSFWNRVDEILGPHQANTDARQLLLSISNSLSDFAQFNKQI